MKLSQFKTLIREEVKKTIFERNGIIEILKSITLSEDRPKHGFGKIAFGDPNAGGRSNTKSKVTRIAKLQGIELPKNGEKNTAVEDDIYDYLYSWTNDNDGWGVDELYDFKDEIVKAQEKFPTIFKPDTPIGTTVYRGLASGYGIGDDLRKKLSKTTLADWKKQGKMYVCKTPVQYNPHGVIQSWTSDFTVAGEFANGGVLMTKQDEDFLFNQRLIKIFFNDSKDEHEILHFGRTFKNNVYISISTKEFEKLKPMLSKSKNPKSK
jgi:hypothetical protein